MQERTLYVDALTEEIRAQKEDYKTLSGEHGISGRRYAVRSGRSEITRIFRALYESFDISDSAEITMEVNPGTVTEKRLRHGRNAASTGSASGFSR